MLNLLKHTFTNSTTFARELLQNSRRAGATLIKIDVTDEAVVFTDNGCGIDDPSILLSIAKSGWEDPIQKNEAPYGAGFLAALFACETINVRSKDYSVTAQTSDLIALKPAEVVREYSDTGMTSIALINPKQNAQKIIETIIEAARGFPVKIVINTPTKSGYVPERIDALDDSWVDIGPGFVNKEKMILAKGSVGTLYLQGLKCGTDRYGYHAAPIHLKSELFRGRMPDREELINKDDAVQQIDEAVRNFLQSLCERELAEAATMKAKQRWLIRWSRVDKLNDRKILLSVGFLPTRWFIEWNGENQPPTNNLDEEVYQWRQTPDGNIKSEIEMERWCQTDFITLDALRTNLIFDTTDESCQINLAAAYAAFKAGLWVTDYIATELVKAAMPQRYIELSSDEIRVVTKGEKKQQCLDGSYVTSDLVRAEKLILTHDELGDVEVPEGFAVSCEDAILFTKGTPARRIAVAASDYMDEESFKSGWIDETEKEIEAVLALMDNNGPSTHLVNVFKKLSWSATKDLKGKSFTVIFNEKGEPTVTLMNPSPE